MAALSARLACALVVCTLAPYAWAQSSAGPTRVVIPPLPPREASASPSPAAGSPYPTATVAGQPGLATANPPAVYGNPQGSVANTGSSPYGPPPAVGNTGAPYGSNPVQTGAQTQAGSLGAQRSAAGYGSNAYTPQWTPPTGPAPATAPSGGPCRLVVSPDRSTLQLADAGTRAVRQHVPLGENRVQKVFNSQDGAWALAIFKVRGVAQYAAIGINLVRCEAGEPIDVPAVASAAQFEGAEAVLNFDGPVQRLPLPAGTP